MNLKQQRRRFAVITFETAFPHIRENQVKS